MPGRSLRVGTRLPNPGAVLKGCPRPRAARFGAPRAGLFGDGTYSGNIMQGGVALQPQDYLLDGVTPSHNCIVVTGAATVDPDPETGAAVVMGCNLVVLPGATLTASGHCKGLLLYFSGCIVISGTMHMTALGRAGNFGNLTPLDLTPGWLRIKLLPRPYKALVVKGRGAEGGKGASGSRGFDYYYGAGFPADKMQTGGGGTGVCSNANSDGLTFIHNGGCGGPCCGGAASSSAVGNNYGAPAGDFGGPAGGIAGPATVAGQAFGGSAGFPAGPGSAYGASAEIFDRSGGGLLAAFAPRVHVRATGFVASDGGKGGGVSGSYGAPGPGAGGGIVIIGTDPGGYINEGTVQANGGTWGDGNSFYGHGGPGGPGSVNIFELTAA